MNKSAQDLKVEIEAIKKTQTEGILEMKNLGKRTETTDASITKRMQEMEENIWYRRYNIRN
jgi:predicted transcriptional regulator